LATIRAARFLGGLVAVVGGVGQHDLGHAGDLGGLLGDGAAPAPGDQHMHLAADLDRGSHRVERSRLEAGVVVFCNDENTS
jgi:hypothetical protein